MLKDIILQNPIISLILILVPAVGITWKIMHALYVKPRDFRISSMEKDIDTLRNEILKIEKKSNNDESARKLQPSEGSESVAGNMNLNDQDPVHKIDQRTSNELVLNDLQALLDLWNDKELTDLQKKHIEDTYTNKSVVWEVVIKSIGEVKDGKIYVSMVSKKSKFQIDSAAAYFDESYKDALLLIKKGEPVIVSGVIERFFLSPMLKDCKLKRK
jgi:hypothetical protein